MSPARSTPRRGDVWWVFFGQTTSGEIQKTRPAVVVSNDAANDALNRVQIVPLTSKTDRLYVSEAYVTIDGKRSKAMADQLTTAAKTRLRNRMGHLTADDLAAVELAIKTQLDL